MFPQTIRGGYLGVSLFFVLSGCLLAYTCEKKGAAGSFPLIAYFRKRIARIYPSLLIMMLVTIGAFSFFAAPVISAIRPEALSVLLGYNNWWQISQSADYFTRLTNQSPFTHLWFLGIELEYYLAWPLLYCLYAGITWFYGRKAGIVSFLAAGLLSALWMPVYYNAGADITRLYYGYRYPGLCPPSWGSTRILPVPLPGIGETFGGVQTSVDPSVSSGPGRYHLRLCVPVRRYALYV